LAIPVTIDPLHDSADLRSPVTGRHTAAPCSRPGTYFTRSALDLKIDETLN